MSKIKEADYGAKFMPSEKRLAGRVAAMKKRSLAKKAAEHWDHDRDASDSGIRVVKLPHQKGTNV